VVGALVLATAEAVFELQADRLQIILFLLTKPAFAGKGKMVAGHRDCEH